MSFKFDFSIKHHFKILLVSLIFMPNLCFSQTIWYRYYDKNGVANISSTVTPEHIRLGYEKLDSNMNVVAKIGAFKNDFSAKSEAHRAQAYQQKIQDQKFVEAYTSSRIAEIKKNEILKAIQEQIEFQKKQLKNMYLNEITLKKQEQVLVKQGINLSNELKNNLKTNSDQINKIQHNIIMAQVNFQRTEQQYNGIISRLRFLENKS